MIHLLLADDHAIVREGLKQLFALAADIEVLAEATCGSQVLDRVRHGGVDLVLLDMTMPGVCGADLIERIRLLAPLLPVLVLSMHNEPQTARQALKAGASGFLTKDNDAETLLAAIRKVAAGGRVIDPGLAEQMAFETVVPEQAELHRRLSERELHILRLLARGMTVMEIALKLAISHKTVSTHKARLMEKMSFRSNAELVRYALIHRLVD